MLSSFSQIWLSVCWLGPRWSCCEFCPRKAGHCAWGHWANLPCCVISWMVKKRQFSEAVSKCFGLIDTLTRFVNSLEQKESFWFCPDHAEPFLLLPQGRAAAAGGGSCSPGLSRSISSSGWADLLQTDSASPKFSIPVVNSQLFQGGYFLFVYQNSLTHYLCAEGPDPVHTNTNTRWDGKFRHGTTPSHFLAACFFPWFLK